MSGVNVEQMAGRVAELMETRLRIGGNGLSEKLRRGARFLPRKVRRAAAYLAQSAADAKVPRMQMRLDHQRIADAYDICIRHLKPLGVGARRRAIMLDILTAAGGSVFVAGIALLLLLLWRGFV
ncbi:MAG: hypothetical protein WBA90_15255 [Albidovulum sp.]